MVRGWFACGCWWLVIYRKIGCFGVVRENGYDGWFGCLVFCGWFGFRGLISDLLVIEISL